MSFYPDFYTSSKIRNYTPQGRSIPRLTLTNPEMDDYPTRINYLREVQYIFLNINQELLSLLL